LFIETLQPIFEEKYNKIAQHTLIEKRGASFHYRHEIHSLKKIDLSWDVAKIERHVRATYMPGFEPPYALINGKKIYFKNDWK
jgi:methionyl-tRNA formyltransferase